VKVWDGFSDDGESFDIGYAQIDAKYKINQWISQ
jgi:hypothetical protein